jgi:CheY-like chemotaxis protein
MRNNKKINNMTDTKSIFLVEDDQDDQYFFMEAMSEMKGSTLYAIANNGREAIDRLNSSVKLPDIIFTDINMPKLNGIDFLKELLKSPRLKKIPVVVLSSDEPQGVLAKQLGAKAFIKKTCSSDLLLTEIRQIINLDFLKGSCKVAQTYGRRAMAD